MPKRLWSVLLLSACLLLFPTSGLSATGSVSYRSAEVIRVAAPQQKATELGSLVIQVSPLTKGEHTAVVSLPRDYLVIPAASIQSVEDPLVSLGTSIFGQLNQFMLHCDYDGESRTLTFVVPIKTTIPPGVTGDIQVNVIGVKGQFTDGSVIVGRVPKGEVEVSSIPISTKMIMPETEVPFTIGVTEEREGVLAAGRGVLRVELPERFEWQSVGLGVQVLVDGGYLPAVRVEQWNKRVLLVDVNRQGTGAGGSFQVTGFIKSERTLLPGAELKAQVSGIDLRQPQTVILARVVEPRAQAWFVVGSENYTVNGVGLRMDVVPYTKQGRIFLPLRYVGLSLGVEPENIKWDGQTAALVGEGVEVRVQPGSKQLWVNGALVEMDVAAELSGGRVMLPYRFIAQAFGASVEWDPVFRTVTMELLD